MQEKSIFYSDMKGPNLLIFRNQQVKLGDLGVSIKLDPEDTDGEEKLYYGKGMTKGYVTKEY
jgi:hypothetical protein